MKDETETLRECLEGWDGNVDGEELAALGSYEGDCGGCGGSSEAMADEPEASKGSISIAVAEAAQRDTELGLELFSCLCSLWFLARPYYMGDSSSLSTNGRPV